MSERAVNRRAPAGNGAATVRKRCGSAGAHRSLTVTALFRDCGAGSNFDGAVRRLLPRSAIAAAGNAGFQPARRLAGCPT